MERPTSADAAIAAPTVSARSGAHRRVYYLYDMSRSRDAPLARFTEARDARRAAGVVEALARRAEVRSREETGDEEPSGSWRVEYVTKRSRAAN
jgi:hypothetical protein